MITRAPDVTPKEVLTLSLLHMRNKDIAKIVHIEPRGVEARVNILKKKFQCETRTALMLRAIEFGIIQNPYGPRGKL